MPARHQPRKCSYKSLESLLHQGLDLPLAQQHQPLLPDDHANLRSPDYYHCPQGIPTMLSHPTVDKLQTLRLNDMLKALSEQLSPLTSTA